MRSHEDDGEPAGQLPDGAYLILKAGGPRTAPPFAYRRNGITVTGDRAAVEEFLGLGGSDAGAG